MSTHLKQAAVEHLAALIQKDLNTLESELESLQQSIENESKSSAGDKYETGREMIAQEIGKIQSNLGLKRKMLNDVLRIDPTIKCDTVTVGAWVVSSDLNYFVSIPYGKVVVHDQELFCISPSSPLIQAMLGLKMLDQFSFNGQLRTIDDIS